MLVVGVSRPRKLRSLAYSISGLVVEYIVAIDVTRVRFLADAQAKLVMLVHESHTAKPGGRVGDHRGKTSRLRGGGGRGGQPEVATMLVRPLP